MSATISLEERDEEPEDEAEDLPDGGIPFIVNRGGLPMNEETWEQMWSHATRIHPEGEKLGRRIRGNLNLPKQGDSTTDDNETAQMELLQLPHQYSDACTQWEIPVPCVPSFQPGVSVPQRLEAVQKYIRDLQYPSFSLSKPQVITL
ncbi:hypothetical protein DNTS_011006 [Danionella cerebrum]|uniref:Uncharacterized protein n=1 Tax=Danionella cerebrum TaxID=2873325 RepID=A0A553MNY9_9TELE|nr:hypothetical protein DNTS_011006 [Danionella translucida]